MAKQGQHHDTPVDKRKPRGHEDSMHGNSPKKTVKMDVGEAPKGKGS